MVAWLLVAHIFGLMFWVSGLLVTTLVLGQPTEATSAEARQALFRLTRIFLRAMADPGALLTILAGIGLISTNPSYYLHATWLHIKLGFVVLLIALHGMVAMRSKLAVTGRAEIQRGQAKLLFVTIVIVFLLILISTLPGEVYLSSRPVGTVLLHSSSLVAGFLHSF